MPIERAVFHNSSWQVYWTAPGAAPPPSHPAPIANFTATQQKPSGTVNFDGTSSSEPSGTIVQWVWDFGDGSPTIATSTGLTSHSYARAGTYSTTLVVTDSTGQKASVSRSVSVSLSVIPISSFTKNLSGYTVALSGGGSSSGNGAIVSYAWSFGDGATATGVSTSHTYSGGGTYTITLVVTDNLGVTGTSSQTIQLSYVPIAVFTSSVNGLVASVDASSTIAPNPISSYTWNWGETVSVPAINFGTPALTVSMHPTTSPNVLQAFDKSPSNLHVYMTQARSGSNGTATPYESTQITKVDANTGAQINSIELIDAGHGLSISVEYTNGQDYIWTSWNKPATAGGTAWDNVRFPWPNTNTSYTRSSPPPGMAVKYPGGAMKGYETRIVFDVKSGRAALCGSGANPRYELVNLADFLAGKITLIHAQEGPPENFTWQGFASYADSFFIYRGHQYTQAAGAPLTDAADPPVLDEYSWITGEHTGSFSPAGLSLLSNGSFAGNSYEPEGAMVYMTPAGNPHVFIGWITNSYPNYHYDVYHIPLSPTTQTTASAPTTGKTSSHTYVADGTYQVGLTVKDTTGLTDTQTNAVYVGTPPPANKPPVAVFSYAIGADPAKTWNRVDFDASASTDPDGTIVQYDWDFQQSQFTSTTPLAQNYIYNAAGTYTVRLTVTDDKGATNSTTTWFTLTDPNAVAPNQPPIAAFAYTSGTGASYNQYAFDASTSKDPDGTIVDYAWDFGDVSSPPPPPPVVVGKPTAVIAVSSTSGRSVNLSGTNSTEATSGVTITGYSWDLGDGTTAATSTVAHTYASDGTYTVRLTVTDSAGATNTASQSLSVAAIPPPSLPPTSSFIWSQYANQLSISADGRSSSGDTGRTLTTYSWNWGDGSAASTGAQSGHQYSTAGTYTVTLTVTDDLGKTGTSSQSVGVKAPNVAPVASFVTTQTNLKVNVDASASNDPDGSIVKYDWDFQQSTYSSTSPIANGYVYNAPGTYTITLTVTDNGGATATTSKQVTVSSGAPTPPPTTAPGDGGGSGTQPTGTGIVLLQNLAGADLTAKFNAAGTSKVSIPAATEQFRNFTSNAGLRLSSSLAGILGAGSKYSVLEMTPGSSTAGGSVPTGNGTTNPLQYIYLDGPAQNFIIDGVMILGTEQGHLYNGLTIRNARNFTMSNCSVFHIPGNYRQPPGETFGINLYAQEDTTATVTFDHVTMDGQGVGASGLATNRTRGIINMNSVLCKNWSYSNGIALWETAATSTVNIRNSVMSGNRVNLGAETTAGTINVYDPIWGDYASGAQDVYFTWGIASGATWKNGTLNFYFTSATNWQNFIANRTRKYIYINTTPNNNYGSGTIPPGQYNDLWNSCNVYVGGVKQTSTNYITFAGTRI